MATSRQTSSKGFHAEVPVVDAQSRAFMDAIAAGLDGEAAKMQQLLRRSLRRPPRSLAADEGFLTALAILTARATPPVIGSELDRKRSTRNWEGPTRVEGERFTLPAHGPRAVPDSLADAYVPSMLRRDNAAASEPVLDKETASRLGGIVAERTSSRLEQWGVQPTKSLLLTGSPGTGKTMCARWLAKQLNRPLFVLNLASVMSHELGGSAKNITEALLFANDNDIVLFIDEFDAVASSRADSNDVGEVRRLVNVLLLGLDNWQSNSMLIAATNYPDLLDAAIARRFDEQIELLPPDAATRAVMWQRHLSGLTDREAIALANFGATLTGSSIDRFARRAARSAALENRAPTLRDVVATIGRSERVSTSQRDCLIAALSDDRTLSQRDIGDLVGVSHTTVRKATERNATGSSAPLTEPPIKKRKRKIST